MSDDILHKHIHATYFLLRTGIAVIAIMFPVVLFLGGLYYGIKLQESMSAYYHVVVDGKSMRDWFVGLSFAIGVFLYLYKGFSKKENYALNLSGFSAMGVAIYPMDWACGNSCDHFTMHELCAVSFFLCLTYVCVFCASETLSILKDPVKEKRYRKLYLIIGGLMVLAPLTAYLLVAFFQQYRFLTFYVEVFGIWSFASYWLVKSRELGHSEAEAHFLH